MLKPCQFRNVSDNGVMLCAKIARGSREVSPEICQACPVAAIDCRQLRFSLEKEEGGSLTVRYGNGRTEVWDGEAPHVEMQRAACSLLLLPLKGTHTCQSCSLRQPAVGEPQVARVDTRVAAASKVVPQPRQSDRRASC